MKQRKLIPTLLAIACIAIGWQLIAMQIGFPALFPSVTDLLKEVFTLLFSENFFVSLFATILRGIIGFAFAFVLAFVLASVAAFSGFWKTFFQPIVVTARSIPVISMVLFALLWFSPTQLPVFIALITMFPILYQSTLTGLVQTDIRLLEMAQVFGKSKYNQFFSIYLPSAKNNLFDGIKTAMGFGWRAIIIGEVLSQPLHGIGTSMKLAQVYINVPELIAWTVVAIAVSYLFEFIIGQIQQFNLITHLLKSTGIEFTSKPQSTEIKKIKIENLGKRFNQATVFGNLNISFSSDGVYCLKGPSGIGKTTLLRILCSIEKADAGEAFIPENSSFAYAFQDIRLLPWLSVAENINYVLDRKTLNKHEMHSLTSYLLKRTELTEHADKYPHELSGGQQQRVGLARALAAKSDILLLDEPLSGLDSELKNNVIAFISEWISAYKPLVVWATHENVKIKGLEIREVFL
jgi:ABC-type nitrate/sulfonate/bicarbonate transport system ATPase subunit/ABC-type nitrate/sulfonate/bicarbonate transport system permease component